MDIRSTDGEHSSGHWQRLENKVDKLTEAVTHLVRIEERQMTHGVRIGEVESRVTTLETSHRNTDAKVERWINRGIGLWALAAILWTLYLGTMRS